MFRRFADCWRLLDPFGVSALGKQEPQILQIANILRYTSDKTWESATGFQLVPPDGIPTSVTIFFPPCPRPSFSCLFAVISFFLCSYFFFLFGEPFGAIGLWVGFEEVSVEFFFHAREFVFVHPSLLDSVYDLVLNDGHLRSKVHLAPELSKKLFHRPLIEVNDLVVVKAWTVLPLSTSPLFSPLLVFVSPRPFSSPSQG